MSGGFFDYKENILFEFADKIFEDKEIEEKQLSKLLRDVAGVLNSYDYWKSGDEDKEHFLRTWNAFLKKYKIKFGELK